MFGFLCVSHIHEKGFYFFLLHDLKAALKLYLIHLIINLVNQHLHNKGRLKAAIRCVTFVRGASEIVAPSMLLLLPLFVCQKKVFGNALR